MDIILWADISALIIFGIFAHTVRSDTTPCVPPDHAPNIDQYGCPGDAISIQCPMDHVIINFRLLAACQLSVESSGCFPPEANQTVDAVNWHLEVHKSSKLKLKQNKCLWRERGCNLTSSETRLVSYLDTCKCIKSKKNYIMIADVQYIKEVSVFEVCRHTDMLVTSSEGYILSPGYPDNLKNVNAGFCKLVLRFNTTVKLQILSEVLELATNGDTDLYIKDVPNNLTPGGPYKGSDTINVTFHTKGVQFEFHDKTTTVFPGFLLRFTATTINDTSPNTEMTAPPTGTTTPPTGTATCTSSQSALHVTISLQVLPLTLYTVLGIF